LQYDDQLAFLKEQALNSGEVYPVLRRAIEELYLRPGAVLSIKDTKIESPYNTYLHPGLPPGPIASPGADSIKAALYPADTDYLYFLAKGDGSHAFSSTYEQFLKDKDKYIN
jgi:uncharacterized YceG family protein